MRPLKLLEKGVFYLVKNHYYIFATMVIVALIIVLGTPARYLIRSGNSYLITIGFIVAAMLPITGIPVAFSISDRVREMGEDKSK